MASGAGRSWGASPWGTDTASGEEDLAWRGSSAPGAKGGVGQWLRGPVTGQRAQGEEQREVAVGGMDPGGSASLCALRRQRCSLRTEHDVLALCLMPSPWTWCRGAGPRGEGNGPGCGAAGFCLRRSWRAAWADASSTLRFGSSFMKGHSAAARRGSVWRWLTGCRTP